MFNLKSLPEPPAKKVSFVNMKEERVGNLKILSLIENDLIVD